MTAVMESSRAAVQDGVVVDYWQAIQGMKSCLERLQRRLGRDTPGVGAAAFPGVGGAHRGWPARVVEALGFDCRGLYEEPTAAAEALGVQEGAIVDIGGGTTGISVLREGGWSTPPTSPPGAPT